jgi:AcrR family transcriptional regulator
MAEVMAEKGYVATSVEDVLKRAVVSRQSFYQLFDSKLDCFMAAFDYARESLLRRLRVGEESGHVNDPVAAFERAFTAYLDVLAAEWPYTRLFLVEVFAAGPDAVRRRGESQRIIGDLLGRLMGVTDAAGRYTCQVIVAATSAMVTPAVAQNDREGLRAVGPQMIEHVRGLWEAGLFGAGTGPAAPVR